MRLSLTLAPVLTCTIPEEVRVRHELLCIERHQRWREEQWANMPEIPSLDDPDFIEKFTEAEAAYVRLGLDEGRS